jgi:hypothetical protein
MACAQTFADEWELRSVFRRGVRARAGEMIKFEQQQGELKDYTVCIASTALMHSFTRPLGFSMCGSTLLSGGTRNQ